MNRAEAQIFLANFKRYISGSGVVDRKANEAIDMAIKALEQPEQKSGEWIYDGVKRICPFCKDFIVTGRSIVKYCWNCGARLKERSKDAES